MLTKLFGGQKEHPSQLLRAEIESELMQALAEVDEDEPPDNGAMDSEIPSEDE